MALKKKLTEEEAWLYVVLTSPALSAEFFWLDANGEPMRLWDYQWQVFESEHNKEILMCARKTSKTTTICARAFSFPFRMPGKTCFLTAAEGVHLERITTELNERIENSYIHKNFFKKASERPHYRRVAFNSAVIFGRVPQKTGVGVKSVHADEVYADEYQDFTAKAKAELSEVFQKEGRRLLSGVPDIGADPHIQRLLNTSSYKVYRFARMFRPDWDEQLKKEKIEEYGSEDSIDYRRNIYGETVEEIASVFPKRLLVSRTYPENSPFFKTYLNVDFRAESEPPESIIITNDLSQHKLENVYIAIDIGWIHAPTSVCVIGEKNGVYFLLKVFNFYRYNHPDLVKILKSQFFDEFKPALVAVDATSGGVTMFQNISKAHHTVVGIDFRKKVTINNQDVSLNDFSVQVVKSLLEEFRLILPFDYELLQDWSSIAAKKAHKNSTLEFVYTKGVHTFDAVRVFAAAMILRSEIFSEPSGSDVRVFAVR